MTINISVPAGMYADAKKAVGKNGYTSISELFRDALRDKLYPNLTENGFTSEVEDEILKAVAEPIENSVEWDGITPFSDFVLTHRPKGVKLKRSGKSNLYGKISGNSQKSS